MQQELLSHEEESIRSKREVEMHIYIHTCSNEIIYWSCLVALSSAVEASWCGLERGVGLNPHSDLTWARNLTSLRLNFHVWKTMIIISHYISWGSLQIWWPFLLPSGWKLHIVWKHLLLFQTTRASKVRNHYILHIELSSLANNFLLWRL